jgi:hypothetical protein
MKAEFVPPNSKNTVYDQETGKLYRFTSDAITVLSRAWPAPRAWIKTARSSDWHNFRPTDLQIPTGDLVRRITRLSLHDDGQLLFPFVLPRNRRLSVARLRWFDEIPPTIRERVARFPRFRHWYLLSFLARCGRAAADLVDSNPTLAFMLASNEEFRVPAVQRPLRAARRLLGKKQDRILEWLGFPGNESTRKIMAKIKPLSLSGLALMQLRNVLTVSPVPGAQKKLGHLETLNDGTLRIICDPDLSQLVSWSFLEETAHHRNDDCLSEAAQRLVDTRHLWMMLRPDDRLPVFRCRKQLFDLQAELTDEQLHFDQVGQGHRGFPKPPLPADGDRIVPIANLPALAKEGRDQNNCVAGYLREVLQGHYFFYSVNWPQRCTLSIVRYGNSWQLGQLKRSCNEEASSASQQYVAAWIERHVPAIPLIERQVDEVPF